MKYILKHPSHRKRVFKSKSQLSEHLFSWYDNEIDTLIENGQFFGWSLEIVPTNEKDKLELYWNEIKKFFANSVYDGELEYLVKNNFKFLAVDRWLNTGSSQYTFSVKLPKKKVEEELKNYLECSDFFICPNCNHHAVYDYDKNKLQIEWCDSCGQEKNLMSYKNYLKPLELLKDIAS